MSDWLPIESAVKDSSARLVWCPDRQNTYIVCWMRHWDGEGWQHFGGNGAELYEIPTHWMPLPNPPISGSGGDNRT